MHYAYKAKISHQLLKETVHMYVHLWSLMCEMLHFCVLAKKGS